MSVTTTLQADVALSATYCEPEQPNGDPSQCIHVVAARIDGLGEWRTCLTVEEAIELRAALYVALCAAGEG